MGWGVHCRSLSWVNARSWGRAAGAAATCAFIFSRAPRREERRVVLTASRPPSSFQQAAIEALALPLLANDHDHISYTMVTQVV